MTHIHKFSYETGYSYNGYRVCIQKKGINFVKYVSAKEIGWDGAEKEAIKVKNNLVENLAKCHTQDDVINFYIEWKKK